MKDKSYEISKDFLQIVQSTRIEQDVFLSTKSLVPASKVCRALARFGTHFTFKRPKPLNMPRKKNLDQEELLCCPIRTRVTQPVYKRLENLKRHSDCHSMGELARRVLSSGNITLFHKDASMNESAEKLTMIYKELKAIGVNMNQITRHFHQAHEPHRKAYLALQIADLYKQADIKISMVLTLISQLSKRWLQK